MNRYVRLDDGTLLDMNNTTILISEFQINGDSVSQKAYGSGSNYYMMSDKEFASITHKSDNLLDLVRVGDCVEMDNEWEILKVLRFSRYNNMVCMVRTSSNTEEYEFQKYRREYVKAIWFRSGDTMKRIGVEHERD